jgi:homocysteine S-methyltransferase
MRRVFLTEGGIETSLIFQAGMELPEFASFPLLETDEGRDALRDWSEQFLALADETGLPFVLDTVTWRANPDWGMKLGYPLERLAEVNREAVRFARDVAARRPAVTVSGTIGPRRDGYVAEERMTAAEAEVYHGWQVALLAEAGVDRITAMTLTYPDEATGIVRACVAAEIPVIPGFTVETDGRLPSGDSLAEAVEQIDRASDRAAAFFMINCAHPAHFSDAVRAGGAWVQRIGGVRANASKLSHAELDESEGLHSSDPAELAQEHRALRSHMPALELVGGCCGTDVSHVRAIADALKIARAGRRASGQT